MSRHPIPQLHQTTHTTPYRYTTHTTQPPIPPIVPNQTKTTHCTKSLYHPSVQHHHILHPTTTRYHNTTRREDKRQKTRGKADLLTAKPTVYIVKSSFDQRANMLDWFNWFIWLEFVYSPVGNKTVYSHLLM